MILFADKIKSNKEAFLYKLQNISALLGVNPDWIMALMNSETGGSFNPQIVNKQAASTNGYDENGKIIKPSGVPDSTNSFERSRYRATGLIQFMPSTAKHLGTTNQQLYNLSNVDQLDYVYHYFQPVAGKLKNYADLYLYAFYPYAVGKPDDYIIGSEKGMDFARRIVQENPLDVNKDGVLTVGEFKKFIDKRIPKTALQQLKKKVRQKHSISFSSLQDYYLQQLSSPLPSYK